MTITTTQQPTYVRIEDVSFEQILNLATEDPVSGCWNWNGLTNSAGYGIMPVDLPGTAKSAPVVKCRLRGDSARRLMARFFDKMPSPGTNMRFTCGNPRCVNPAHNAGPGQRCPKAQHVRGARHHKAVLDDAKVREIRARLDKGEGQVALALEFGVTQATISMIKRQRIWVDVPTASATGRT